MGFIITKLTLTTLTSWLNENFSKKNGKKFLIQDAQQYTKRGYLPKYLGGNEIIIDKKTVKNVTLYKIRK